MTKAPNPLDGLTNNNESNEWALESTQKKLLQYISLMVQKYSKVDTASLKNIVVNTAKLVNTEATEKDILKKLAKSIDSSDNKSDSLKKIYAEMNQSNKKVSKNKDMTAEKAKKTLRGRLGTLSNSLEDTIDNVSDYNGSISSFSKMLKYNVPLIGGFLGAVAGFINKSFDTWQQLSSVGATFNGSVSEMSAQLLGSGLGYSRAAKYLTEFSDVTSGVGTKYMLDLQKQTRLLSGKFGNFGLNIEQLAEFTGSYLKTQQALGLFNNLDTIKQSLETKKYIANLHELSRLTGKNVNEMDKQRRAFIMSADTQSAIARITSRDGIKIGKNYAAGMAEFATTVSSLPGELGAPLMKMMTEYGDKGTVMTAKLAQVFSIVGGDLSNTMDGIINAAKSGDIKRQKALTENLRFQMAHLSDKQKSRLSSMKITNSDLAASASMLFTANAKLASQKVGQSKTLKEWMQIKRKQNIIDKEAAKRTIAMVTIGNKLNDIFSTIISHAAPLLIKAIGTLALWMNKFVESSRFKEIMLDISDWIDSIPGKVDPFILEIKKLWKEDLPALSKALHTLTKITGFLADHWKAIAIGFGLLSVGKGILGLLPVFKLFKSGLTGLTGFIGKIGTRIGSMLLPAAAEAATVGEVAAGGVGAAGVGELVLGTTAALGATAGIGILGAGMIAKDTYDVGSSLYHGDEVQDKDIGGVVGGVAGGILGAFIAGPLGVAVGMAIGNTVGGYIGGLFDDDPTKTAQNNDNNNVKINDFTDKQLNSQKNKSDSKMNIIAALDRLIAQNQKIHSVLESDNTISLNTVDYLADIKNLITDQTDIITNSYITEQKIAISVKRSEPDSLQYNHSVS